MKTLAKTHSAKLEVWLTPKLKKDIQDIAAAQGKAMAVYLRDLFENEVTKREVVK
jgi:hypothetical protein